MKSLLISAVAAALFLAVGSVNASAGDAEFQRWKALVAEGETEEAAAIVGELRERGPEALDELLAVRDRMPEDATELDRFIDAVGGQRYCGTSRLFWYTDLKQACRAAEETGRPILSLRLLGKLTDELSCANSRFFRTTLYANAEISRYLREHFILHWESVRPAPVMTIDFGDGRRMIRTVTGNSIHYVLDAQGRPLDALPGLYGPQPFQEWLKRAQALGVAVNRVDSPDERSLVLSSYHGLRLREIEQEWRHDLETLGLDPESAPNRAAPRGRADRAAVPAEEAVVLAIPKCLVEARPVAMLRMIRSDMAELTTDSVWRDIARLHADESELDDSSRQLIFREVPALRADRVAVSKSGVERLALTRLFSGLRTSTALDSVRNEYELHWQIHEWFLAGEAGDDVDSLNRCVYAELFLTPDTDPWLGLYDPTVYTGLTNAGIVEVSE
jgi:hypothetical protein